MKKPEILKIVHSQLKGLFDSLDKKGNYREEIIKDYHSIISHLRGHLSLNNLDDFKIPPSALVDELFPLPDSFNERYFNGQIVRAKMRQLLSVVEGELSLLQKERQSKYPKQLEITLWSLIHREIKKILLVIDKLRIKIEGNLLVKILILVGAVAAGIFVILSVIK